MQPNAAVTFTHAFAVGLTQIHHIGRNAVATLANGVRGATCASIMRPTVIIIGRPNVGKSTLFNRLVGKKLALVDDQPGVTRDRRMGDAELAGMKFTIVDTAGWEDEEAETLPGRMRAQTEVSVEGADAVLFVIDARAGITPLDEEIGRWLRTVDVPVVLVANKAEGKAGESGMYGKLFARPWRTGTAFPPNMATALPTCSKACGP